LILWLRCLHHVAERGQRMEKPALRLGLRRDWSSVQAPIAASPPPLQPLSDDPILMPTHAQPVPCCTGFFILFFSPAAQQIANPPISQAVKTKSSSSRYMSVNTASWCVSTTPAAARTYPSLSVMASRRPKLSSFSRWHRPLLLSLQPSFTPQPRRHTCIRSPSA